MDWLTAVDVWVINNAAYPSLLALAIGLFFGTIIVPSAWRHIQSYYRDSRLIPANFISWDQRHTLPVWQAVWLWCGYEPRSLPSDGTPVYSVFQIMKQDLREGVIPNKRRRKGSWMYTELTRDELRSYAEIKGERPKFLYPEERNRFR